MVWKTHRQVGLEVEDRAAGGWGAAHLPGPPGGLGEVPGRPQGPGPGGHRRTPDPQSGGYLPLGGTEPPVRGK